MANKVTIHFAEDRIERAAYIADTVGFGEMVRFAEYYDSEGRFAHLEVIETGVVVIYGENRRLVTMYIAQPEQLVKIFYTYNWGRVPAWLMTKAKKNQQKGYIRNQPNYHH